MTCTRSKAFNVLFTSDVNKKRKVYHDGTLNLKQHALSDLNITASLFAVDKSLLRKSTEKAKLFNDVSVGDEISIWQFSVQIESILEEDNDDDANENSSNVSNIKKDQFLKTDSLKPVSSRSFRHPNSTANDSKQTAAGTSQTVVKTDVTFERSIVNMGKFKVPTSTNERQADSHVTANCSSLVLELDSSLSNRMRQHQIDGAMFLLNRLTEDSAESRSISNVKGAILADEVFSCCEVNICKCLLFALKYIDGTRQNAYLNKRYLGLRQKPNMQITHRLSFVSLQELAERVFKVFRN